MVRRLTLLLPLTLVVLSGCQMNMQRTDVLSQIQYEKLTLADQQLAESLRGGNLKQAVGCIRGSQPAQRKQCAEQYISGLQAELQKPREAYQSAARSVRGECHNDLQKVADGLGRMDRALGDLGKAINSNKPKALLQAAGKLGKSWSGVPRVETLGRHCAARPE